MRIQLLVCVVCGLLLTVIFGFQTEINLIIYSVGTLNQHII